MRYHVWVSQLRTLDLEIEAATADDAERQVRSRLHYPIGEESWLESATVIKVGRAEERRSDPSLSAPERHLLPIRQAAEFLGVGRTTVYKLLSSDELASTSVGHRRFISRHQLEDYIARQQDRRI